MTTLSFISRLFLIICLFSLNILILGCDDEAIPEFSEGVIVRGFLRDMAVIVEEPPDAEPFDQEVRSLDMTPPSRDLAPFIEPECDEGTSQTQEGCGYLRCERGQWVMPTSPRETCNQHDDDCDGNVDETFSIGEMCFALGEDNCQVQGVYRCDLETQSAMCVPSNAGVSEELCDGVDNDCDGNVDEGFPASPICCTESLHCPPGSQCVGNTCDTQDVTEPNPNPDPTENNMLQGGTCGNPIPMPNFGLYFADGTHAEKNESVVDCTGELGTDVLLAVQTGAGSEVIFSFNLNTTQRVRLTTELSLFASVIYVRQGACSDPLGSSLHCDESILGLLGDPPRSALLEFEALAGQTYYVTLDTKVDIVEVLELFGGSDLGAVPFVLDFQAAN